MGKALELMKQVAEVLADYDKQALEGLVASIPVRREALKAVRARYDAGEFKGKYASIDYAYAQIEAVGGKGWMELLRCGNVAIGERLAQTEAMKAKSRNAKIAAKLDHAGIHEITGFESSRSSNGFTGRWSVETDKGAKHVFIDVILAGGYNIQCLHSRVLANVK